MVLLNVAKFTNAMILLFNVQTTLGATLSDLEVQQTVHLRGITSTDANFQDDYVLAASELDKARRDLAEYYRRLLAEPETLKLEGVKDVLGTIKDFVANSSEISKSLGGGKGELMKAFKYIQLNMGPLIAYGGDANVVNALDGMATLAKQSDLAQQSIKTMAQNLDKGATAAAEALSKFNSADGDPDTSKQALEAALVELGNTLDSSAPKCEIVRKNLEALQLAAAKTQTNMNSLALIMTQQQKEGSETMQSAKAKARQEAYISCAAICAATLGFGCAPCFAAAIPIVEAKIIPDLKKQLQALTQSLEQLKVSFSTFANVAKASTETAAKSVSDFGLFTAVVVSARDFVAATLNIEVAVLFVEEYKELLKQISQGCQELLIAD